MRKLTKVLALCAPLMVPSVAVADGFHLSVGVPIVVPREEFHPAYVERGGYYVTPEGHRYHYDKGQGQWHYGRNHDEGQKYDRQREQEMEHRR